MKVCVIGLGFVGLTFAVTIAKSHTVVGIDSNSAVTKSLALGKPHFFEPGLEEGLRDALGSDSFSVRETMEIGEEFDVFVIAVGTPVESGKIMTDALARAKESIQVNTSRGSLVLLRSTVPIGQSQELSTDLCSLSHKVVFAPERTAEGVALKELISLPQILGSSSADDLAEAEDFFTSMGVNCYQLESFEEAEMVKLASNSYRDYSFAFANNLALVSERLGISSRRVTEASNYQYSRGGIPFPGPTGGPCLTKDPRIFAENEGNNGLVSKARTINDLTVDGFLDLLLTGGHLSSLPKEPKVLISGIAFKGSPATSDIRDSHALKILDWFRKKFDSAIFMFDEHVIPDNLGFLEGQILSLPELENHTFDCVVLQNNNPINAEIAIEAADKNKAAIFIDFWGLASEREMTGKYFGFGEGNL